MMISLFVNRVLFLGLLHLDGYFARGLIDVVVFAKGAQTMGNDLYPNLSKGNAADLSFAVFMGLEFQAIGPLFSMLVHPVQNNFGIAYRLSVLILNHDEL